MNQQAHGGAKCMWGGLKLKIGDFRQITGYISKTVQDRRIVSIKVKQEVVCALSNGDIADNLEWPNPNRPKLPQFLHFAPFFHIFIMGIVRNIKFGLSVNGCKSKSANYVIPEMGVVTVT